LFETNRVEKDTNILKNLSKLIYKPKEAKTSDAYQKKNDSNHKHQAGSIFIDIVSRKRQWRTIVPEYKTTKADLVKPDETVNWPLTKSYWFVDIKSFKSLYMYMVLLDKQLKKQGNNR
jgi:hypothetical protein